MKTRILTVLFVLSAIGVWAANDYYTHGNFPSPSSPATSAAMRAELDLISVGFDKMPPLTGNAGKAIIVNAGGTGLTATAGNLLLGGNLTLSGAFAVTLQGTAPVTLTLPNASSQLATLTGAETFTGKSLNLSTNSLTGTIAQFNAAVSDGDLATLAGAETLSNKTLASPTITGETVLSSGGIRFPSVQVPSGHVNMLDDYEEGDWTPALTCNTPGNLTIVYNQQLGRYIKIGKMVWVTFNIITTTFTHTTASGDVSITGLPFTAGGLSNIGTLYFSGLTKANYTQFMPMVISGFTTMDLKASGQGQTSDDVAIGDMPTGGSVVLHGTLTYEAAN